MRPYKARTTSLFAADRPPAPVKRCPARFARLAPRETTYNRSFADAKLNVEHMRLKLRSDPAVRQKAPNLTMTNSQNGGAAESRAP
ncbi:MAG: hypothetical protein DMG49_06470 [Acidobacteria bacterium]|nr:MAG: hypothetical protein DMG49_06470 [Acidobacteriota bacterium]